MSLILVVEPDSRHAAQLASIARNHLHAELVMADSGDRAVAALDHRVPDIVLTAPLLPHHDEAVLSDYLRALGDAGAHVQTLTIPILSTPGPAKGGVRGRFRKERATPVMPDGCDPALFAEQVGQYLHRARQRRVTTIAAPPAPAIAFRETPREELLVGEVLSGQEAEDVDLTPYLRDISEPDDHYELRTEPSDRFDAFGRVDQGEPIPTYVPAEPPVPTYTPLEPIPTYAPVEPVQRREPVERAEAFEAAEPAELTEPFEPTERFEPYTPSEPIQSPDLFVEPVQTVAPVAPVARVAPIAPVEPVERFATPAPVEPAARVEAVQPFQPAQPVQPIEPIAPTRRSAPVAAPPAAEMTPVVPVAPVAPAVLVTPVVPVAQVAPVAEVEPVAHVAPVAPVVPVAQVEPVAHVAPVAQVAPVAPVARSTPASREPLTASYAEAPSRAELLPALASPLSRRGERRRQEPQELVPVPAQQPVHVPQVITVPANMGGDSQTTASLNVAVAVSVQVAAQTTVSSGPSKPKRGSKNEVKPAQDEWGFFDPDQCGFRALLARLDAIAAKDDED